MTTEEKLNLRKQIVSYAGTLLGIPYKQNIPYKLEDDWLDYNVRPKFLDCELLVKGSYGKFGLRLPSGAENQYLKTIPVPITSDVQIGDLGFWMNKENWVHHVIMLYDDLTVIEARGNPYNKVILRPRIAHQENEDFQRAGGWRSHPELV